MEVIGATANIAAIVSIAGQALDGIIRLRAFFKECASASKTIDRFLRDLNSLIQTLEDVKCIIATLEDASPTSFERKTILSSLHIQLEDCSKDAYDWVRIAAEQNPKFTTGSKATFKKFLVAANKDSIEGVFKEIASHKENITLKLSVIGRSLDVEHASKLQTIDTKLDEFTVGACNNHDLTHEAIMRLEKQLTTGGDDPSATPSLRSLASQMSRIENMLSSRNGSQRMGSGGGSSIASQRDSPILRRAGSNAGSNASSTGGNRELRRVASTAFNFQRSMTRQTRSNSVVAQVDGKENKRKPADGGDWVEITHTRETTSLASKQAQPLKQRLVHHEQEEAGDESYALEQAQTQSEITTSSLIQSYRRLLDVSDDNCPKALLEYIDLVQCFRTISMHTKLLSSVHDMDRGTDTLRSTNEYLQVLIQLENVKTCINTTRELCWRRGYNIEGVDQIIETGHPQHSLGRNAAPNQSDKTLQEGQKALLALQKRFDHLKANRTWLRKQDRVNFWLLQILATSDEATSLHRSFLPDPAMPEDEWAKLVLKFWPVDGAAVKLETKDESEGESRGAVNSGKPCHSIRVLLELMDEMSLVTGALSVSAYSDAFGIDNRVLELERLGKSLGQLRSKPAIQAEILVDDVEHATRLAGNFREAINV